MPPKPHDSYLPFNCMSATRDNYFKPNGADVTLKKKKSYAEKNTALAPSSGALAKSHRVPFAEQRYYTLILVTNWSNEMLDTICCLSANS